MRLRRKGQKEVKRSKRSQEVPLVNLNLESKCCNDHIYNTAFFVRYDWVHRIHNIII